MASWPDRCSTDGTIADSCDADVCKKLWAQMGADARNIVMLLFFDPFMLYTDNSKYSCAPLVAIFQNLPADIRWEHCAAHLLGIEPGSRDRDVVPNRHDMLELVKDEISYLAVAGVWVIDSHKKAPFK